MDRICLSFCSKDWILILLISLFIIYPFESGAQINILGKPGYVLTPSSRWDSASPMGTLGLAYIPRDYAVKQFYGKYYDELMMHATVDFTSFIRLTFNLAYIPEKSERMGLGDRHFDVSLRILKERKYLPSLTLILTPPIGVSDPLTYNLAVASKQIGWNDKKQFEVSVGYGLKVRYLDGNSANGLMAGFYNRKELNEHYLNGFFAGSRFMPFKWIGLTAEYDSRDFNGGMFLTLAKKLTLQLTAYGFERFGGMVHLHLPLTVKNRELRKYEKD
jgi:hypothetical protein